MNIRGWYPGKYLGRNPPSEKQEFPAGEHVLSELILNRNTSAEIARLQDAGYMSPQNEGFVVQAPVQNGRAIGFSCRNCDYGKTIPSAISDLTALGLCTNPKIFATVEAAGCCNRFSFRGVHTD